MMRSCGSGALFAVLLGTLSAGCPGGDRRPPFELERLRWEQTVLTAGFAHVDFRLGEAGRGEPFHLEVEMEGFPAGTELSVAGTTARADESGALSLRVAPGLQVGALDVDAIDEERDIDVPITLTVPGAPAVEERLPPIYLRHIASRAFRQVRDGPVRFHGEPEEPAEGKAVAVVSAGPMSSVSILGEARQLWDVDFVAVTVSADSGRTEHCEGYQRSGSDDEMWIVVEQHDTTIGIYDRRTGEKLSERTFQPAEKCPERAYARGRMSHTSVRSATYRPWIESELARLGQH